MESDRLLYPYRYKRWLTPSLVVAVFLLLYLGIVLARAGGDPLAFARVGEGFRDGKPLGEPGYDGQFAYFIALDPRPALVAGRLDVPAYRYQRILYPLLARLLAAGSPSLVPWALVAVNLAAQVAGAFLVEAWLVAHGLSRWYALSYGLWAGLVMAVRLDLNEPLCYALVAGALLAQHHDRPRLAAACLGLAVFAKETALLVAAALIIWAILARRWNFLFPLSWFLIAFAIFQFLLFRWFGAIGLTSGGYLATPFEWVPFLGLWRVGVVSREALALLGVIFGPLVVVPSLWGIGAAARRLWQRDVSPAVLALATNATAIAFTPFSTFREPLGLVRFAAGLVLATVLFGAHVKSRRVLNYSMFWLSALALIIQE